MSDQLPKGIYENLVTSELKKQLEQLDTSHGIARYSNTDEALACDYLTRSLSVYIQQALTY